MRSDAIVINRQSTVPLHRQLENALREAILCGALRPGERMLSSRELQLHLGVSRNTVMEALTRLEADGFIATKRGVGTFVSAHLPTAAKRRVRKEAETLVPSKQARQFLRAQTISTTLRGGKALRPGLPALEYFPDAQLRRSFHASDWACYTKSSPQRGGLPALRTAIANRLRQSRGVACAPEQVFVTSGAQGAFALILRVLLHDDDAVVIEDPAYPDLLALLRAHNARVLPVPVDENGIRVDDFRNVHAKAAFVTPSHQYPTGAVLSLDRRMALLKWAGERAAWIVEDDYDSEFHYTRRPEPPLQGLDANHRVIYVGTFSKVLSPALRVGYAVVPESLVAAFEAAHDVTGASPAYPLQAALARFVERGHLGRYIAKMRKIYAERRKRAGERLVGPKDSPFLIRDHASGLHFVAELPASIPDVYVSTEAAKLGLAVPPLSRYYIGNPARNGLVIGFAGTSVTDAEDAIMTLFAIVERYKAEQSLAKN